MNAPVAIEQRLDGLEERLTAIADAADTALTAVSADMADVLQRLWLLEAVLKASGFPLDEVRQDLEDDPGRPPLSVVPAEGGAP